MINKRYDAEKIEKKWQEYWDKKGIYKFDVKSKNPVYSVDTPPPTVSGKVHIGHAFSYSQQDFVVRYQRMKGKNVFYPFGTDDNGVATERLIEKMNKVKSRDMDREKFIKLCLKTLDSGLRDEHLNDFKQLGLSCDWTLFYTTMNKHCQKISQRSFLNLYKNGREYRKEAPTMWCPQCQTGISQVECQNKELKSFFNDIIFKVDNEDLIIATTRPELLPACVAVFYHPDDKRYQKYKGKFASVPLFGFKVPILSDERADPEKGTGIVMCCTFGDQTDMEWQKAHDLPIKTAISGDGSMTEIAEKYRGLSVGLARKMIIEDMKDDKLLISQEPIKHMVNVHERCGTEIEFIHSKQWFIKYLDIKKDMLKWGKSLNWYPKHMYHRYEHWVKGLQWDWLISRQRHFGIPFPVWYCENCDKVIVAEEKQLPVDPLKDKPLIKKCSDCGHNKFIPEKDVLDTWATSSLTPQLAVELINDEKVRKNLYPMSLRPQGHDIITFWLFNTVVKSRLHNKINPWKDVVISGHALDPHGRKMSKSKGNVVYPKDVLNKYSADCLRFWAAGCKLGDDLSYQEKDLVTGQKFINKLWNASKFVFMHIEKYKPEKVNLGLMDKWFLSKLNRLIMECTESFDKYEYMRNKTDTEKFFWHTLCDNYLEIVKHKLYNPDGTENSAKYCLYFGLLNVLKLIAPIMPHITEEVYSVYYSKKEKKQSIHISEWPKFDKKLINEDIEKSGDAVIDIISEVRKYKSKKNLSLNSELNQLIIECTNNKLKKDLESSFNDLKDTLNIKEIEFGKAKEECGEIKISIL